MSDDLLEAIRKAGGDPEDAPFWQGCREGRFLLHRCGACRKHYWPASRCTEHGAENMQWVESSGAGELYTYTILHHAYTPSMKDKVPYVVGVIKLAESPFFHSNVECAPEDVQVGMKLKAHMTPHESGLIVPIFSPA